MIEVPSRPGSIRSTRLEEESGEDEESDGEEESEDESEDEENEEAELEGGAGPKSDVRSIRSFGSMMSEAAREERRPRKSLTDRLANVSARLNVGSPSRDSGTRKVCSQPD